MIKKIMMAFCFLFPATFVLSCSNLQNNKVKQKQQVIKLNYDFSYQNIDKEELENQFNNFKENTLFHVTLKNSRYNGSKKEITKEAYYSKEGQTQENIIWPGEKKKISIKDWIWKMFSLTPIGIEVNKNQGKGQ